MSDPIDRIKFNALPMEDKAYLVRHECKFVSYTDVGIYRVQLYSLYNEFVEVWFNPQTKTIERIAIPEYHQLDKHLNNIPLEI